MRRRSVNWIHQQSFHVSAMGLDIVILRSTPSVSTVRLLSGVLHLLPDPEDWAPWDRDAFSSLSKAAPSLHSCHTPFPLVSTLAPSSKPFPLLVGFIRARISLSFLITLYPFLRKPTLEALGSVAPRSISPAQLTLLHGTVWLKARVPAVRRLGLKPGPTDVLAV